MKSNVVPKTRGTRFVLLVSSILLSMCNIAAAHDEAPQEDIEIHAETIAYFGHGMLFDEKMREIPVDAPYIVDIQEAMIEDILEMLGGEPPEQFIDQIEEARALLDSGELTMNEAVLLKTGIISLMLQDAPEEALEKHAWRNNALATRHLTYADSLWERDPELIEPMTEGILDLLPQVSHAGEDAEGDTPYMAACRAMDVPIPPDWAEHGTEWVLQGMLTQNMLQPGQDAAVWTYSDPSLRGGCIALPRGDGSEESLAGIICQSATTGHACFWENRLKTDPKQQPIGWRGLTLDISTLRDGTDLACNCTRCHSGDNVYLMAPDDPTWSKLLRGPLNGPVTGTFTTQVESSSDVRDDCPRYIPITTNPPRPAWENRYNQPGCAEGCHGGPEPQVIGLANLVGVQMPPNNAPPYPNQPNVCNTPAEPRLNMRRSLSFGSVPQKDVRSRILVISNALGSADLTVSIPASQPPPQGQPISGFFWSSFSAVIPAGQTRNFHIDFSPRAEGPFSESVTVTTNMPQSPHSLTLTGRGLPLINEGEGPIEPF